MKYQLIYHTNNPNIGELRSIVYTTDNESLYDVSVSTYAFFCQHDSCLVQTSDDTFVIIPKAIVVSVAIFEVTEE